MTERPVILPDADRQLDAHLAQEVFYSSANLKFIGRVYCTRTGSPFSIPAFHTVQVLIHEQFFKLNDEVIYTIPWHANSDSSSLSIYLLPLLPFDQT